MKLVRTVFIALAVLLPVSWTTAKAADPAPAMEGEKKDKKSVKTEKTEKTSKTEKSTTTTDKK
jgi:hypothetical protein